MWLEINSITSIFFLNKTSFSIDLKLNVSQKELSTEEIDGIIDVEALKKDYQSIIDHLKHEYIHSLALRTSTGREFYYELRLLLLYLLIAGCDIIGGQISICLSVHLTITWKVTSRQRSGKGAIRKKFPLQKLRWKNLNCQLGTYTQKTYCKQSEQLFPNRQPLSYRNLNKNMKTYS